MENSKLNQLLAKLDVLPMENESIDFVQLDDKCEHLKGVSGSQNSKCRNISCDGSNIVCSNGDCSGTNGQCSEL
jgi:hypothetical protein